MNDFLDTIYYYTNGFYSQELDNYLYKTMPGYLHVGLVMLVTTCIASVLFYYLIKPIRRQNIIWFITAGVNAIVNFLFALWYTMTPLINNEIDASEEWSYLDCTFFSITNVIWSFIFFVACALLIKWWSPAKYVPFRKF